MDTAVLIDRLPLGAILLLKGASWREYSRFLRAFEERPGARPTYDNGLFEFRAPSTALDWGGRFLGRLVATLTEELQVPLFSGGSTTIRDKNRRCGIEPDECFWIDNAQRMAGCRNLDLRRYPPPDLVIDVDVTHSSLDRKAIYAALRVPELWQLEGDSLLFFNLQSDGRYREAKWSKVSHQVSPHDLIRFYVRARRSGDQNPIIRDFRKWVRTLK
jgi:Uma2 family endonuclease